MVSLYPPPKSGDAKALIVMSNRIIKTFKAGNLKRYTKTTYSSYTNHTFWFLGYKGLAMNLENYLNARNVFLENKV